jgi:ABC-type multidrug transport system fused ATPase/permease subunit
MKIIKYLYYILTQKQRGGAFFQFLLMIVSMFFELISIGMLVPVVTIISSNDLATKFRQLKPLLNYIGNPTQQQLLIYVMSFFGLIYCLKMLFMTFVTWANFKYIFSLQIAFSERLFKGYMKHPIIFHLERNSAQLIQNTINLVATTTGVLVNIILISTEIITASAILILLLKLQPIGLLIMFSIFTPCVFFFHFLTKKKLLKWGSAYQIHEGKRIQHLQEAIGAVKDIKLLGRENYFFNEYHKHNKESAYSYQRQQTFQALPRFFLEFLAVVCISLLVIIMVLKGDDFGLILTTLGLFAGAAFRLMPSLNRILGAVQILRFSEPVLQTLSAEFDLIDRIQNSPQILPICLKEEITLNAITFKYATADKISINNITLSITVGSSMGFVGTTGAGKSTLVDIILGLLSPVSGTIRVDGVDIQNNLRDWQDQIGYVPQSIFLTDNTLRRNIAFGIPDVEIDIDALWEAIKSAQLEHFIKNLPEGLDTMVGEKGVRISGGERQRIGIARALYHNPKLLVLDEATSSLDIHTEQEVMKAVQALHGEKTIIIVAHRLSTIEHCDRVFRLNDGKLEETEKIKFH